MSKIEKPEKVQILFPRSMILRMDRVREERGLDRSNLVRQAVADWLDAHEAKRKDLTQKPK